MNRDELKCTWSLFTGSVASPSFVMSQMKIGDPKEDWKPEEFHQQIAEQNGKAMECVLGPNLSSPKRINHKGKIREELSSPNTSFTNIDLMVGTDMEGLLSMTF